MDTKKFPITEGFSFWFNQKYPPQKPYTITAFLTLLVGFSTCAMADVVARPFRPFARFSRQRKRQKRLVDLLNGVYCAKRIQPFIPGSRDKDPEASIAHYRNRPPKLGKSFMISIAREFLSDQLGRPLTMIPLDSERCIMIDCRVKERIGCIYFKFSRTTSDGPDQGHDDAYFFLEVEYDPESVVMHIRRHFAVPKDIGVESREQAFETFVRDRMADRNDLFHQDPLELVLRKYGVTNVAQVTVRHTQEDSAGPSASSGQLPESE